MINNLLISFTNKYNEIYEQFEQVYIILTHLNIEFKITNDDKYRYRMFQVSEFQEDDYEYVIKELFKKLPFHFDNIEYLNKQNRLCCTNLINTNKIYDPSNIQFVVSYYNEDLSFLDAVKKMYCLHNILLLSKKHAHHEKYPCIPLPNIGRDCHSFIWYVCENYDSLPENILFTQGGVLANQMKFSKFKYVLNNLSNVKDLGIVTVSGHLSYPFIPFDYDFILDEWGSTNKANSNNTKELIPACVRPFGKWYETYISADLSKIKELGLSFNCIFCCSKYSIRKYPKSMYEELLKQLSVGDNLEVIHYVERIFYSLFKN